MNSAHREDLLDAIAHARWCSLTGRKPDASALDAAVRTLLWGAARGISPREPAAGRVTHYADTAHRLRRGLPVNGLRLGEGGAVLGAS